MQPVFDRYDLTTTPAVLEGTLVAAVCQREARRKTARFRGSPILTHTLLISVPRFFAVWSGGPAFGLPPTQTTEQNHPSRATGGGWLPGLTGSTPKEVDNSLVGK